MGNDSIGIKMRMDFHSKIYLNTDFKYLLK